MEARGAPQARSWETQDRGVVSSILTDHPLNQSRDQLGVYGQSCVFRSKSNTDSADRKEVWMVARSAQEKVAEASFVATPSAFALEPAFGPAGTGMTQDD